MIRTALVIALSLTFPACTGGATHTASTNSTTTPPALAIVSVDDIRDLTNVNEFHVSPGLDVTAPVAVAEIPDSCRGIDDPPIVFGNGWKQFRSIVYRADIPDTTFPNFPPSIAMVGQTVAAYADPAVAQATFDRLITALPACTAANGLSYDRQIERPDQATVLLNSGG